MSLVGPRPLLIRYLPYYTPTERARHTVRPGLSGLAQISGRNYLEWNSRLALDVEYVNTIGCLLDLRILVLTVVKVFKREDVVTSDGDVPIYLDCERRGELEGPGTRP
jgi:undecaprenyl phosphate N,N'-diacetylbacillosamine 1-phosphate transferase